MSKNEIDRMVDVVRDSYHVPGETPKEAIWDVIEQGLAAAPDEGVLDLTVARKSRSLRQSRYFGWSAAAAAVLALGIGIGRMSSPGTTATPVANTSGDMPSSLQFAAAEHFGRTESLLTMVRSDARQGQVDPMTGTWARGLLVQTRMLMDARTGDDPVMIELLEDLELVLAQVVGLAEGGVIEGDRTRTELDLALRGVEERELLPRLQAAGRPLGLSGT
jgi:hypothetical protein